MVVNEIFLLYFKLLFMIRAYYLLLSSVYDLRVFKKEIEKDIFTRIILFPGIVRFTSITTETAHYKQPVHNRTDTQRNCYHRKCSLQKLIIEGTDN